MSIELMTFGEFLSNLIKNKNISITRLAELTNMKSRNSIQRILKDESSITVIESFKAKLLEVDPLKLSGSELKQLEQSIEVFKAGKDKFGARKILLEVFNNSNLIRKFENPDVFNPHDQESIPLRELLDSYKTYTKIKLLLFGSLSAEFTNELYNLLRTSPPGLICIAQILHLGKDLSHNAAGFASIFKLFNFQYYEIYGISSDQRFSNHSQISPNTVLINKETADGSHYTDLIKLDCSRNFSCIINAPGSSLFDFYAYHFEKTKLNSHRVKRTYNNKNSLETILAICEACLEAEKNCARYIVKHSFSSSMIPYGILMNILAEANYFGLDKNSPIIQRLKQVFYQRLHFFTHTDKPKVNFLTKRGLLDFVQTRVMTDHFSNARPFTKEEVKTILEFNLKRLENDGLFKILLLKDDYSIANIEFSYYENKMLWIFDSCSGYGQDYYEGVIESGPILEVYDDFIKNELLKNHTLPESETTEFLKYLLSLIE